MSIRNGPLLIAYVELANQKTRVGLRGPFRFDVSDQELARLAVETGLGLPAMGKLLEVHMPFGLIQFRLQPHQHPDPAPQEPRPAP